MATAGSTGEINLTKKASPKVLERFKRGSATEGLFSHDYDWTGVATVQIYSIDNLPLNDYNPERIDGGSRFGNLVNVGDTIQELTVKDNKSFIGAIDETYNTQQLQIKRAGQILKRQTDEVMIPYTDKYRLRKLASFATAGNKNIATVSLSKSNVIESIMSANAAMSENLVPDTGRVCYMSYGDAIKLKLADQVVGTATYGSGVGAGSLGQKAIVNGVMGTVDKCQIRLVPAGYLPAGVKFMIVKSGVAFAPMKIQSYKVHNGGHILDGKIVTGHLLHDCFVPQGREQCIFVVTSEAGHGDIATVGTGVLTVTSGTATVSSGATSITLAGGAKNVTVSTLSSGVETADVIAVESADESKFTAKYDPTTGLVTITPKATCSGVNLVVKANGKIGWDSPADVAVAVTIT